MGCCGSLQINPCLGLDDDDDLIYVKAIQEIDWRDYVKDENEMQTLLQIQQNAPVPIIDDFLYQCGATAMLYTSRLQSLGITHVLNVAGNKAVDNDNNGGGVTCNNGMTIKTLNAQDRQGYPMLANHLDECRAFIADCREAGGKCVVHCQAGSNRSAVIVAAELMLAERKPLLEAIVHCRKRRGDIFLWNQSFIEELTKLARTHGLLGPKPGSSPLCVVV